MPGEDRCPLCQGPVRRVVTELGRRIALDPDPHPEGTIVPLTVAGRTRARVLTGERLPAQETAWRDHDLTCPEGRAAKQRAARLRPRCTVCGNPLDELLIAMEPSTTHPCCVAPERVRRTA
jgi:hypothetical protein